MTTWVRRWCHVGALFLGFAALYQSPALCKDSPEARVKQLVSALQARHAQPQTSGAHPREPADAELDGLFDFDTLAAEPIAPHKKAFNAAQLKAFNQAFRDLIRSKALRAGAALSEGALSFGAPVLAGQKARTQVHVVHPEKDIDSRITFVWAGEGGPWRVVDVELDGSSVVKDYQNQFGRILKKDGPDGLIAKIRARLVDARQAR